MDPATGFGGVIHFEPLHPGPENLKANSSKITNWTLNQTRIKENKGAISNEQNPHIYPALKHNSPSLGYNVTLKLLNAAPKSLWEYGINGHVKSFSG